MPVPSCDKAGLLHILINTVVLSAPWCQRREVHVAGKGTAARVMPVQRIEMTTQDMDVIADLMNERYAEHRARFWCYDPGCWSWSRRPPSACYAGRLPGSRWWPSTWSR